MNVHITPRFASFLTLGLLTVIGIFLVLRSTPEGLGLSDDSIAYIAGRAVCSRDMAIVKRGWQATI